MMFGMDQEEMLKQLKSYVDSSFAKFKESSDKEKAEEKSKEHIQSMIEKLAKDNKELLDKSKEVESKEVESKESKEVESKESKEVESKESKEVESNESKAEGSDKGEQKSSELIALEKRLSELEKTNSVLSTKLEEQHKKELEREALAKENLFNNELKDFIFEKSEHKVVDNPLIRDAVFNKISNDLKGKDIVEHDGEKYVYDAVGKESKSLRGIIDNYLGSDEMKSLRLAPVKVSDPFAEGSIKAPVSGREIKRFDDYQSLINEFALAESSKDADSIMSAFIKQMEWDKESQLMVEKGSNK